MPRSCFDLGCAPLNGAQFHCAACHQTFGTLGEFDDHQETDQNGAFTGVCREPETLGLLLDGKGTWQSPEGLISRARSATRAREMRRRQANAA